MKSSLDSMISQAVNASSCSIKDLLAMGATQERIAITSVYFSLISHAVEMNGGGEVEKKLVRNQVRDKVVAYLDHEARCLIQEGYRNSSSEEFVLDRLRLLADSIRGGSSLKLVEIVRTFTSLSVPYGQAQSSQWLSDSILTLLSEFFFVKKEWLISGEGAPAPIFPKGFSREPILDESMLSKDIQVKDVTAMIISTKSEFERANSFMLIQRAVAFNVNHPKNTSVEFLRPLAHVEYSEKGIIESWVHKLNSNYQPIELGFFDPIQFLNIANGGEPLYPAVKAIRTKPTNLNEIRGMLDA